MGVIEAGTQPAVVTETGQGFDYAQIDEGIRDEVRQAARSIRQLEQGVITGVAAIGKRLLEVKDMLEHGQFEAWIEGEFGMKPRLAQNYMNVARECADPQKRKTYTLFTPSVAYLLAAPSTPEAAREEVEQAAQTQHVTVEFAKQAIQKHKPEPVQYAPVWELEGKVREWLVEEQRNGSPLSSDANLDTLKVQTGLMATPGNLLDRLDKWLTEAGVTFRKSDLTQAINNVREQRRSSAPPVSGGDRAKRQESARVVYTEPQPITDEEAAALLDVAAEHEQEEAQRLAAGDGPVPMREPAEPKPKKGKPSKVEIINRDLDAYEAEAQREVEQWRTEAVEGGFDYQEPPDPRAAPLPPSIYAVPAPDSLITIAIPRPLLAALHSDLLIHYPRRALNVGELNQLAVIAWRALEGAT